MSEQLFFLSSKYAHDELPSNSYIDFTTSLPDEVVLPSRFEDGGEIKWSMAVTEYTLSHDKGGGAEERCTQCGSLLTPNQSSFDFPSSLPPTQFSIDHPYIILCDLVEGSFINGAELPILRIVRPDTLQSTSLAGPYYIPLNRRSFKSIRIYLLGEDLTRIKRRKNFHLSCTLHLVPSRL